MGRAVDQQLLFNLVIWLLGSTISVYFAYEGVTYLGPMGDYIFFGPDSFYHASRILSSIPDINQFYQYDERSSSWISWPWAYDWSIAVVINAFSSLSPSYKPELLLAHMPPVVALLNVFLVLQVGVKLQLLIPFRFLLVLAFSLSPLSQSLHLAGRVDHHMIELSFTLICLYWGVSWLSVGGSQKDAFLLGLFLGVASAFHNGLFILQAPLVMCFSILWLCRQEAAPFVSSFCISLVISSVLVLMPSPAFNSFEFTFYLHSWFHLYVTLLTVIFCYLFSKVKYTTPALIAFAVLAVVLVLPLSSQLLYGSDFLSGGLPFYVDIAETEPPFKNMPSAIERYGYLFFISPVFIVLLACRVYKSVSSAGLYVVIYLAFGLLLMLMQKRLHYFGLISLYLPMLYWINNIGENTVKNRRRRLFSASVVLFVCCQHSIYLLFDKKPLGGSFTFQATYPIYNVIKSACQKNPGMILADYSDGHFLGYYSSCSMLANNMLISPEDIKHVYRTVELLAMSPLEFIKNPNEVRYVYVRRADNIFDKKDLGQLKVENEGLRFDLLFNASSLPKEFERLAVINDPSLEYETVAAFYRIR